MIKIEFKKNRIKSIDYSQISQVKTILKKLKLNDYYEHIAYIISKISGKPAPSINRETEEKLKKMFDKIQEPFEKNCPKDRINFLSYSYVLHKFFQLLELDDYVKCFPLLKSRTKLRIQDDIWKKICDECSWQFYPSV
jgi:L-fucose mutarotase/ribose pyranase (RbsD/FucU family)